MRWDHRMECPVWDSYRGLFISRPAAGLGEATNAIGRRDKTLVNRVRKAPAHSMVNLVDAGRSPFVNSSDVRKTFPIDVVQPQNHDAAPGDPVVEPMPD